MIDLSNIRTLGNGLNRPECVLTHQSGLVFASDWTGNGGVSIIRPNGQVKRILSNWRNPLRPNGIALDSDGSFLLAHLGNEKGGVFRMRGDGCAEPLLTEVAGQPLPPTNFVACDRDNRYWITVSTRKSPRALAYNRGTSDGFLIRLDEDGAVIAADNLGYTNECLVSADHSTLYVNETFARRLSAFSLKPGGVLGERKTVATFGEGTFPDGLNECTDGSLLVTSIVSNRVIMVEQSGVQRILVEDCNQAHIDNVERAYSAGAMGRPHLDNAHSLKLRNISSLAFRGPDSTQAALGCLLDDCVYTLNLGVSGSVAPGWSAPLSEFPKDF